MATTATFANVRPGVPSAASVARSLIMLVACAGLPLGLFGLANLGAETLAILPLFFAPFGLPGWTGAVLHLAQLALLGSAFWALTRKDGKTKARFWLAALIGAYIVLPFVTAPLDSLQLAVLCSSLLLFAVAALMRVSRVSALAGWLISPMLAILGFSAVMGLAIAAAYSPPFALVQGNQPTPAA